MTQAAGVELTVVTYTTIIDAGARAGDGRVLERGLALLQEMRERALAPNVVTFNAVFKAYAVAARAAIDARAAGGGSRRALRRASKSKLRRLCV